MFEVVLSTMETKLQKVESLDKAVHHLMRRMETMERRISSKTSEVLRAVQRVQCHPRRWDGEAEDAMASERLNVIDITDKLDKISEQMSKNHELQQEQLIAQPSNRQSRILTTDSDNEDVGTSAASIEDVKEVINGIDKRLGLHINIVSENLGKMSNMVEEVRDALIEDNGEAQEDALEETPTSSTESYDTETDSGESGMDAQTILWLNKVNNNTRLRGSHRTATIIRRRHKTNKFDKLFSTIHPLLVVSRVQIFITVDRKSEYANDTHMEHVVHASSTLYSLR